MVSSKLVKSEITKQVSDQLRNLELKIVDEGKKAYLKEAVDCFEIGAIRATIIMTWILTLDHLYDFIFKNQLSAFNGELAKNTDKRVKVSSVTKIDDFSEIPEGKFIEFARAAKIISSDVRKILDQKLGIRNSCAHASGVLVKRSKAIDFVEDLVENVILKYPS